MLPRHARARHRTVLSVAGESTAAACGELHSGVASYGGQPNIPCIKLNLSIHFVLLLFFYSAALPRTLLLLSLFVLRG
jgi:hypothetical protein